MALGLKANGIDEGHILRPKSHLYATGKVMQNSQPLPMYTLLNLNEDCQGISVFNEFKDHAASAGVWCMIQVNAIATRPIEHGLSAATPARGIADVSHADDALWSGRLDQLADGIAQFDTPLPIQIGIGTALAVNRALTDAGAGQRTGRRRRGSRPCRIHPGFSAPLPPQP
jgi:hypothetical protein